MHIVIYVCKLSKLATVCDHDRLASLTRHRTDIFHGPQRFCTIFENPKHHVPAIQPRRVRCANEKLRTVRVGTSVCH